MIYYVNAKAKSNGNGSKELPFKTINQAAAVAKAGDEVIVKPGIYREQVVPRFGGTESQPVFYRSESLLAQLLQAPRFLRAGKNIRAMSGLQK